MCDLTDLTSGCGDLNPPGLAVRLYVVHKDDIDTFPLRKITTGPGDSVTLDGDIVLVAGKKWAIVDIVSNSGKVIDTLVGAAGAKAFESTLDGIIPTTDAVVLEWMECNANGCLVILAKEKSGQIRVLGSKDLPAILETATIDTGAATGDTRGATIQIKADTGKTAPIYEGAIDLTV